MEGIVRRAREQIHGEVERIFGTGDVAGDVQGGGLPSLTRGRMTHGEDGAAAGRHEAGGRRDDEEFSSIRPVKSDGKAAQGHDAWISYGEGEIDEAARQGRR